MHSRLPGLFLLPGRLAGFLSQCRRYISNRSNRLPSALQPMITPNTLPLSSSHEDPPRRSNRLPSTLFYRQAERRLRPSSPNPLFIAYYSPRHVIPLPAHTILDTPQHPKQIATIRRYEQRPLDNLWWFVKAPLSVSGKRVVRSWAQRRIRLAWTEILAQYGMNIEGRHITAGAGNYAGHRANGARLTGSLRIHVERRILNAKSEEIKIELGKLLQQLLVEQRKESKKPSKTRVS